MSSNSRRFGPVPIAGLKLDDAIKKIETVVSEQMIGIKSSITMGKLRTIRIFVLGEVEIPGSYVVGSLSTMTNAIFASGGISNIGSLRRIQLKREGEVVTELDLYDLLLKGDTRNDARLLPGDVIFVPPIGKTASVEGAVKRPAIYELIQEKSAQQLIELAGGLTATAYLPASKIERISDRGEKTLVDIEYQGRLNAQLQIKAADKLIVGDSLDQVTDTVSLVGHVKRAEEQAWKKGLTFTDIVSNVDDLLPLPDLNLAIIARENIHTREIEILSFSPKAALASPKSEADIALMPRDELRIFGFEEERTELLEDLVSKLKLQASFKQRHKIVSY